jgi:hypothetical protein
MAAQATGEGRFLGGRPPYGYVIADAGPHPNPAKAADGKRLHRLDPDPEAFPVVRRIFAEFTAGHGIYAIADGLTRDGIPSPSAHDRARNSHRHGIAWHKSAVRAILTNPRYTGYQVWNKQRKDEVLIDVDDVALGHVTRLRWNGTDKWLWSQNPAHPPVIDRDAFDQVRAIITRRASAPAARKPRRTKHPYALHGCVWCGLCGRRMQSHWANGAAYYRCRPPAGKAPADHAHHPRGVSLREDLIIGQVEQWLASELAPHQAEAAAKNTRRDPEHPAPRSDRDTGQAGKSEIFRQLGLKLIYHPGGRVIEATINSAARGPSGVPVHDDPAAVTTHADNAWSPAVIRVSVGGQIARR